jgi:5'-3' exonuclease
MGIKKLSKYLKMNDCIIEHDNLFDFTKYVNKKMPFIVAIDTSLYFYKYIYSFDNYLLGFIIQCLRLLSHKIIPIYIFEGTPPEEKIKIIQIRQEKRNKIKDKIEQLEILLQNCDSIKDRIEIGQQIEKYKKQCIQITKDHITKLKMLLDIFGIRYIHASGESDSLCSYMYKNGIIDACLSDDMDILVSGCERLIKLDNKKIIHYSLQHILFKLNLTYEQFLKFIIFFGCDYVKTIPKLDTDVILQFIRDNRSMEYIVNHINENYIKNDNEDTPPTYRSVEEYESAINLFKTTHEKESFDENFSLSIKTRIDKKQLFSFMEKENIEDNVFLNRVSVSINKINSLITKRVYADVRSVLHDVK